MKIPLSLIRSYIHLDEPLTAIAETLTLLGIEVDTIENETPRFSKVIAAEVRTTKSHPNADSLTLAQVFDGAKEWSVVCGAKNCRAGLKVAFAPVGAALIDEHKKERRITEATIRGAVSQGMLCSAAELGIPGDANGLLELPSDIPNGQDLTSLLWDPVFEISLTPNLGHCMSALGIARELSAALQRPFHLPKLSVKESETLLVDKLKVAVQDPQHCLRYMGRLIENIQIGPSPFWLQQTLLACGLRPINNVVDITNYILIKTGQPLHAFDYDKIEGRQISVQVSDSAQSFIGLDDIQREIPPGALLICDARKTLALAGIMGGASSAVSETTRSVVIEAAVFQPMTIRKTARQIKLSTDSSQRFEKGVDGQGVSQAINEASHWIIQIGHGHLAKGVIDIKGKAPSLCEINLRPQRINQILGTQLSMSEVEDCLQRIGCKTHSKDDKALRVSIPSFRNDISTEIDLVEEVARIYGYNNIEKKTPLCTTSHIPIDPQFSFEREVRRRMVGQGLQELITCNLIGPKLLNLLPPSDPLVVMHSKSEDYSILRPSLLPSLLEVVQTNLDQKNASLSAFEIGRIHLKQNNAPIEIPMLGIVMVGKTRPHHWDRKPSDIDYYDLKGTLETILAALIVSNASFHSSSHPSFHPNRQADLHTGGLWIGTLGEVHPQVLEKLGIKERVYFAELNLAHLLNLRTVHLRCHPLPKYPGTERDWTLPLPQDMLCQTLFEMIRSFQSPLLEKAELIDLYVFNEATEVKRNATFRFTYRDPLKTVSFEEAEAVHDKLMAHVLKLI
ncbi:MAG: pheT [Parachlamydiales bacterium]|nr:pheT [Parachlamydiales bacterium]